jgi:hypothetical protein
MGKRTALILDLGRSVRPFITPGDPDAVELAISEHTSLGPAIRDGEPGPIVWGAVPVSRWTCKAVHLCGGGPRARRSQRRERDCLLAD